MIICVITGVTACHIYIGFAQKADIDNTTTDTYQTGYDEGISRNILRYYFII